MKPQLYDYSNYREFLSDFLKASKLKDKKYSYRFFGKKAGFTSPNFLYLIIKGQRNLTKEFLPKFANAMGLNKKEQQYFEALVAFNQAKTPETKRYYLELLHNIKRAKLGSKIENHQFDFVSKWYYAVIWELVACPHFKNDPHWIRKELKNKISATEAKEAIEKMIAIGLLTKNDDGSVCRAEKNLATDDEVYHTAAYSFHQEMLSIAKEVLAKTDGKEREMSGVTIAVSENQFEEIKRMIHDFRNHVVNYLNNNDDQPGRVFQLNMHLFPLSGSGSSDGDE